MGWTVFLYLRMCLLSLAAVAVVAAFPASQPALGIDIVMRFDSGDSDKPAGDPNGALLRGIMAAVEMGRSTQSPARYSSPAGRS